MSNVYVNHQQEVDKRQTEKWKHSNAVNIVHVTRTARVEHSTAGQGNAWLVYQHKKLSLRANFAWSPSTEHKATRNMRDWRRAVYLFLNIRLWIGV